MKRLIAALAACLGLLTACIDPSALFPDGDQPGQSDQRGPTTVAAPDPEPPQRSSEASATVNLLGGL